MLVQARDPRNDGLFHPSVGVDTEGGSWSAWFDMRNADILHDDASASDVSTTVEGDCDVLCR